MTIPCALLRAARAGARPCLALAFLLIVSLFPSTLRAQQDSAAAPRERWQVIYENDRMTLLLDTQTIRAGADSVFTVWTDWRYAAERELRNGTRFDSMRSQEEVDCDTRVHRPRRTQFYLQGQSSGSIDEPGDWNEPVPGSLAEFMVTGVCSWIEEQG